MDILVGKHSVLELIFMLVHSLLNMVYVIK
jgi:hypothetical protein